MWYLIQQRDVRRAEHAAEHGHGGSEHGHDDAKHGDHNEKSKSEKVEGSEEQTGVGEDEKDLETQASDKKSIDSVSQAEETKDTPETTDHKSENVTDEQQAGEKADGLGEDVANKDADAAATEDGDDAQDKVCNSLKIAKIP